MSVTQRLARVSAHHPWRMLGLWLALIVASFAAIAGLLGSALSTESEVGSNPESVRAESLVERGFPDRDITNEVVVVRSERLGASEGAFRSRVADLRRDLESTGATRIVSDPYAGGEQAGISADGRAVLLSITMVEDGEEGIEDVIARVEAVDAEPAYTAAITGDFTLDHDFNELAAHDLEVGELQIGLPAALIVLLLVFGALVAALVPVVIAIVSIIAAVAMTAVVGQVVSLSFFIVNMISAMGLALGIDYSLFVISRYREERHRGRPKMDAIVMAGGTASKAVLFSGSSFVVALFGLLLVPDTILRSLAFGAILVGLVTIASSLTLLPALLSLLGDRVDRLRLPYFGRETTGESRFWTRTVGAVVRRPASFTVASVLLLLLLAAPVLDLRTGSSGVSSLPDSTAAKAGFVAMERSFPGSVSTAPARVVVSGDIRSTRVTAAMDGLEAALDRDDDFGSVTREVSQSGQVALLSFPLAGDPNNERALQAVERLRSDLVPAAFAGSGATALVGGVTAENLDYSDLIAHWLPIVLAFVLGLSLLLLTVVFRSVVLAATAVVLNLLSVGAAYGLLVLVFQWGVGAELLGFQEVERVEAWVPVFLFSVLFALSMDYHVFLLTRIRERYATGRGTVDAVVHGISTTGRLITGAAVIIVVVFAGFAMGQLVMFQQMGFGVGVALLLDATLIRTVLVPAVMTLLDRWNWYLPAWLGWLPELHVEGDPAPSEPRPAVVLPQQAVSEAEPTSPAAGSGRPRD